MNSDVTVSSYLIILAWAVPLLSSFASRMVSQRYSWLSSMLSPLIMLSAVILTITAAIRLWPATPFQISIPWIHLSSTSFTASLMISQTSLLMMTVVTIVSFVVHSYSVGYMAGDPDAKRFFIMLGIFTFTMNGIVLTNNLLLIFLFWELVGFSSYMLIGHWYEKPAAAKATTKAFVMNRIGDVGFIVALLIIYTHTSSLDLSELTTLPGGSWMAAASLCLFCGVIAKSAQLPLFTWLPDAMEGPTPVSALIHAATMVAAGVYLLIRTSFLFTDFSLDVVLYTGLLTALAGAVFAAFQFDIKRILAYSTMSQLGLMIMAIGSGAPEQAYIHLLTHAFFKAGLFLGAGSIIHAVEHAAHREKMHGNPQDIRNLGGLRKKMPVTFLAFTGSAASLAGLPFFSGFLSKEGMLMHLLETHQSVVVIAFFVISSLTVLYTARLVWYVFFGNGSPAAERVVEAPPVMMASCVFLAFASLWPVVSIHPLDVNGWWTTTIPTHSLAFAISMAAIVLGIALAYNRYRMRQHRNTPVLENALYIDAFYERTFAPAMLRTASAVAFVDRRVIDLMIHTFAYVHITISHITASIDRFIIDGIVHFCVGVVRSIGAFFRTFQSGKIQLYIFWSILGMIIFLIWTLKK